MNNPSINQFQQQALDALIKQQDAYLALVREWKANAASAGFAMPEMPTIPGFTAPALSDLPSPAEVAQQQQQFYTRLMEQQQRFMASLNDILGAAR
ncbi:hypothetical protein JT358_08590 [Micrococcales bacterium 31B]|nr:hypothetical protein [Micrococcales bacterium 31B]